MYSEGKPHDNFLIDVRGYVYVFVVKYRYYLEHQIDVSNTVVHRFITCTKQKSDTQIFKC